MAAPAHGSGLRRSLLAVGASVVLLAVFLLALGPGSLAAHLAATDPAWLGLGLGLVVVSLACWSEGLRPLLADAGGPVSARRTALAFSASMCGRQLVPVGAVGGPALTAYAVDRESALDYEETLAVVTVAEFLSTVASLTLAAIGVLLVAATGTVDSTLRLFATVLLGVAGLLAALAGTVWYRRRTVEGTVLGVVRLLRLGLGRISSRLAAPFARDRAAEGLHRFYATVDRVAAHPRTLAVSLVYHQLGWVCMALPLSACGLALGVRLPVALVFFAVPASLLVDVLPLPGGLGGIEFALSGLLIALAGVDLAMAGAIVVLYRLCSYWFVVAIGGAAAVYSAVSVRELVGDRPS